MPYETKQAKFINDQIIKSNSNIEKSPSNSLFSKIKEKLVDNTADFIAKIIENKVSAAVIAAGAYVSNKFTPDTAEVVIQTLTAKTMLIAGLLTTSMYAVNDIDPKLKQDYVDFKNQTISESYDYAVDSVSKHYEKLTLMQKGHLQLIKNAGVDDLSDKVTVTFKDLADQAPELSDSIYSELENYTKDFKQDVFKASENRSLNNEHQEVSSTKPIIPNGINVGTQDANDIGFAEQVVIPNLDHQEATFTKPNIPNGINVGTQDANDIGFAEQVVIPNLQNPESKNSVTKNVGSNDGITSNKQLNQKSQELFNKLMDLDVDQLKQLVINVNQYKQSLTAGKSVAKVDCSEMLAKNEQTCEKTNANRFKM